MQVSTKEEKIYGTGQSDSVVVIDVCEQKMLFLRSIRDIGYKVIQLPWNTSI